jgi:hypothetical protein
LHNPTPLNRNDIPPPAQNRGQANAQPNWEGLTSAPPRCLKCGKSEHMMTNCRKGDCYCKGLFMEYEESADDALVDVERGLTNDAEKECEEELVQGDEGPSLVVRSACKITPRNSEGDDL